ncbi:unnamed protein product [Camellia sinensis]
MANSQNSKFKCFSGILRCVLYIGSLPTQPSDPTTDIPTTTTTFENPKQNFKTQVKTPGVVARLVGLDSLPDPRKLSVGLQQYTLMDGHRMLLPECLDNENLEHLAMMERLLGPLQQHMITSADLRAEKYFKRSARLDWLEGANSKESTRAVWKLPRLQVSRMLIGPLGFLRVLLEKYLINVVSNRNSSNATELSLSGNEIRKISGRGRGGRRGRPRRQQMPIPNEIPAQQEGVGQANVAEPVGQ